MKKVLITPLDWGLGHATRCIPIIQKLLDLNCKVFIAGSGASLSLLKQEFPQLQYFAIHAYSPIYPEGRNMVWQMVQQLPKFIKTIKKEHEQVASLIKNLGIDIIISDNRYGCWSANIPSIFVTHQINIQMPKGYWWLEKVVNSINHLLIKKFTSCWIPDYEDQERSIAGKLSRCDKTSIANAFYIGPLSRFSRTTDHETFYDVACVLSGPEPQRSIFEHKVEQQLRNSKLRYFIVRGIYDRENITTDREAGYLKRDALQRLITKSDCVIARSGYSTIMDLIVLGKRAILVPTPAQTEQEYLAERWKEKGILYCVDQENFNLDQAWKESKSYTGFNEDVGYQYDSLKHIIKLILDGT